MWTSCGHERPDNADDVDDSSLLYLEASWKISWPRLGVPPGSFRRSRDRSLLRLPSLSNDLVS